MHQHLKIKELVAAAHDAAPELPPAAARLMRDVASRLDVTFSALCEKSREVTAYEATVTKLTAQVQGLAAEMEKYRNAHPQPFGPVMMRALEAYEEHQDDVPETGMLNAFFILRDSIRVDTEATDAELAEIRAQGVDRYAEVIMNTLNLDIKHNKEFLSGTLWFAQQLRKEQGK